MPGWFVHQGPIGAGRDPRYPVTVFGWAGPHIAVRKAPGSRPRRCVPSRRKLIGVSESTARNLLVYCAQEMNHLAGFLADLWESAVDESEVSALLGKLAPVLDQPAFGFVVLSWPIHPVRAPRVPPVRALRITAGYAR